MEKRRTNKEIGDQLEKEVAAYYSALGYKITRNPNISGHQIDFIAKKFVTGMGYITLHVEVKSRNKPLGINQVTTFKNTATNLLLTRKIQGAVLVTNSTFTQDALSEIIFEPSIRFLTITDLKKDVLDFTEAILKWKLIYEQSDIFNEYISLDGVNISGKEIKDITSYIHRWVESGESLIVITGDFGSGKTTLSDRINYLQCTSFLSEETCRLPITLRLRSILSFSNAWEFIRTSLLDIYNISLSEEQFLNKLHSGELLLILDGFDEIDSSIRPTDRARNLSHLSYILGRGSPVILTTRPTYFNSFRELTDILKLEWPAQDKSERQSGVYSKRNQIARHLGIYEDYIFPIDKLNNSVSINTLTPEQITLYLHMKAGEIYKVTGLTYQEVSRLLFRVYDLEDLAKRPLLLKMILATILLGAIDFTLVDLNLGPSDIYSLYTEYSAARDAQRLRAKELLSRDDRLHICRYIALRMNQLGKVSLDNAGIMHCIQSSNLASVNEALRPGGAGIDRILTDVRVCSFLSFDNDGSLKFAHKSFMEFFIAQAIVHSSTKSIDFLANLIPRGISEEIVYFLGSFARNDSKFARLLFFGLETERDKNSDESNAIVRILWTSGTLLSKRHLKSYTISRARLAKSSVAGLYLERSELRDISIRDSILSRCHFATCIFVRVTIDEVSMEDSILDCKGEGVRALGLIYSGGRLKLGTNRTVDAITIRQLPTRDWEFDDCQFNSSEIEISGKIAFRNVTFRSGCSLVVGENSLIDRSSDLIFEDSEIQGFDLSIISSKLNSLQASWVEMGGHVSFSNCVFRGLWMTALEITQLGGKRSPRGKYAYSLSNCRGVIITADREGDIKESIYGKLRQLFPDIVFVDLILFKTIVRNARKVGLDELKSIFDIKKRIEQDLSSRVPATSKWILDSLETTIGANVDLRSFPGLKEVLDLA